MPGNTFGTLFRVTTWGESHGPALGAIIDGCPPNLSLTEKDIQNELDRRKPGQNDVGTARKEGDKVKILSGIFNGKTLGTPISLIIENKDQRSRDYSKIKDLYRPGHADYSFDLKYGVRDYRGGGRSSGRETVGRVMAGAIAKKYLKQGWKTEITGYTTQVGPIKAQKFEKSFIEKSSLRCADPNQSKKMEEYVLGAKKDGDSVGGIAEFRVKNTPPALGEPVFDKLQADLGKALFSIATVKGVEFGKGFESALLKGSENNDELTTKAGQITTKTNNAGGIYGGISIGTDLILKTAIKPASSIIKKQQSVNNKGKSVDVQVEGRHDACILPRFIPVAESMIALVLIDHALRQRALEDNN